MRRQLILFTPPCRARAQLTEENPKTCEAIWSRLPIVGSALRWGKEVYFYVDFSLPLERGREVVDVGDIVYWPEGKGIGIFFGPTPASEDARPRAYSPVNVFARIVDDPVPLDHVRDGEKVELRRG